MKLTFSWSDLAALTDTPGTGGVLRTEPADFVVEERPAYLPCGEGDFVFVRLRKVGHTTIHVVRELVSQLGINEKHVGVAGLKDRHAVTTQWLSLPDKAEGRLERFSMEGVEILEVSRHGNKLGMGHLQGNRFRIRVRQAPGTYEQAAHTLELLARSGVPNYFGPQRFGLGGLNAEEGLRVLRGESSLRDPRVRRFLVSSVQSVLFNAFVSLRLQRGLFDRLVVGDMARKHDTGGVFRVEDAAAETSRAQRGEISATGTLFGRKVRELTEEAGALEREVLGEFALTPEAFRSRKGDRRTIRIFPGEMGIEPTPDGYWLSFELPKGSFATSVMREVLKTEVDAGELPESDPE
ncbi:tRNA pseudouridine(13) synthase TruD [Deinococcus peraridilitoris]|uniref:tRNA pseudouridine(13) synthase TruD n=1 Tax=Deinococcus peraridilitoris TaxID=432329 RepID=UPI00059DF122|nr:tRNA pseudouridine(13) synthase TruD [Deinococcus peraridilitoris]